MLFVCKGTEEDSAEDTATGMGVMADMAVE